MRWEKSTTNCILRINQISIVFVGSSNVRAHTSGKHNLDFGAKRYCLQNACCAEKSKTRQIILPRHFGILISFPRQVMNTKVVDILVLQNLGTEFALFRVQMWEIWCPKGRAAKKESLDELDFVEIKFCLILKQRAHTKIGGAHPKGT